MILNTVAVNLKDSPPFASMTDSKLPEAGRLRFQQILTEGKSLQSESNFHGAAGLFTQAIQLEPQFAEAHYRRFRCCIRRIGTEPRFAAGVRQMEQVLRISAEHRL